MFPVATATKPVGIPATIRSFATVCILSLLLATAGSAQPLVNSKFDGRPDPFYPIDMWLTSPNQQRLASGAPGPEYWQQKADYDIAITLDDTDQSIRGNQTVKYENRSPHSLSYIWFQLDQNTFKPDAESHTASPAPSLEGRVPFSQLRSMLVRQSFPGGYVISSVTDGKDAPLANVINGTMMRVDMPQPLKPGEKMTVKIAFQFKIVDAMLIRARSGYEFFEADGNHIYEMAQWFPRLVAYTDYAGWQHEQFIGKGEFTLEFGDYNVRITVPADMIVAATGELQNPKEVLTATQIERLDKAAKADKPMFVVTPDEAKAAEKRADKELTASTKTWQFVAKNVRDFAFAASRKFIWDAVGHPVTDRTVMAMSYYPNEAEPLWSKYSTAAIAHTLEVYGKFTFDYPYPIAISVNGPVYGMEYPMICFNGPRPEKDGTYSAATKYGLISVIIHEVGHNWFPMIVNSDERTWSWMDEGLNTFLQYLAEQEWEEDYPSRRGEPADIVGFMTSQYQRPIMTQSESILQFGNNAYGKPATALNILRETILGRELFDFAFKEYSNRWRFKRPMPDDFFRTMEDASGQSLDWFWRGWFYSTDHVDIAIDRVRLYQIDSDDPDENAAIKRRERDQKTPSVSKERNAELPKIVDLQPGLKDFYNNYDDLAVLEDDRKAFRKFVDGLNEEEQILLKRKTNFYVITFRNIGGLVMPIIFHVYFDDGTSQRITAPPSIWRLDPRAVDKLLITDKTVQRIELDPQRQTADAEESNNHWPVKLVPSRFKLFKSSPSRNPMQRAKGTEGDVDKPKEEAKPDNGNIKTTPEKEAKPSVKQPESDGKPAKAKKPTKKVPDPEPAGAPQ